MKKRVSAIWTILLIIFFFYLLYQSTFAWNEEVTTPIAESTKLPEDKTSFIIVKDTHFGVRRSGISSVQESLEMWDFDKRHEQITLKHKNLLPTEKTQMVVLYDKGYDSFTHHSDVLSLINFPYEHHYDGEAVFKVHGINKAGEVYLTYKNKKIHLKPGDTYYSVSSEGYKVTLTTIKNYGLYQKNQFNTKGKKDSKNGDAPVLDEINLDSLKKQPLESTEEPVYDSEPLIDMGESFFMEEEKED